MKATTTVRTSTAASALRSGKSGCVKPVARVVSLSTVKEDADRILRDFAPLFKRLA